MSQSGSSSTAARQALFFVKQVSPVTNVPSLVQVPAAFRRSHAIWFYRLRLALPPRAGARSRTTPYIALENFAALSVALLIIRPAGPSHLQPVHAQLSATV